MPGEIFGELVRTRIRVGGAVREHDVLLTLDPDPDLLVERIPSIRSWRRHESRLVAGLYIWMAPTNPNRRRSSRDERDRGGFADER